MDKYLIPNLAKACRVLHLLAAERRGLSVTELARRLAMPRTTAFRVLKTLCAEGMIERRNGGYRSGTGLLRLGLEALRALELRTLAAPILRKLARTTGETAHLAVRESSQMLILEVCDSPNPLRVASRPGSLVSIHCAATGKAMLATLPADELQELLAGLELAPRTPNTITSVPGLEKEIEAIRPRGYAVDNEEYHDGVRCLAAPVRDAHGAPVAAIGITGVTIRFTKRRIPEVARAVMQAAESLSSALGNST